jgi:hypothetical protein
MMMMNWSSLMSHTAEAIVSHMGDPEDLVSLSLTCQVLYINIRRSHHVISAATETFVKTNETTMYKWFFSYVDQLESPGIQQLAELIWNKGKGIISLPNAMKHCIYTDNLPGFQWLFSKQEINNNNNKNTDLMITAAMNGRLAFMQWLVLQGVCPSSYGSTIMWAASLGRIDMLDWLSEQGVTPDTHEGEAMAEAASGGHIHAMEWLEQKGVSPNACAGLAMTWAARSGHIDVMEWLEQKGVSPNAYNGWAMVQAAHQGHLPAMKWLHTHGVSPHALYDMSLFHATDPDVIDWLGGFGI